MVMVRKRGVQGAGGRGQKGYDSLLLIAKYLAEQRIRGRIKDSGALTWLWARQSSKQLPGTTPNPASCLRHTQRQNKEFAKSPPQRKLAAGGRNHLKGYGSLQTLLPVMSTPDKEFPHSYFCKDFCTQIPGAEHSASGHTSAPAPWGQARKDAVAAWKRFQDFGNTSSLTLGTVLPSASLTE